jgi:hypothetical protein
MRRRGYLSNPAPIYPQVARDQEQEGLAVLDIVVGNTTPPLFFTCLVDSLRRYHSIVLII